MELLSVRETFTNKSTISRIYANGVFLAYVLEPVDRNLNSGMSLPEIKAIKDTNPPGTTAIPYGTYPITIYNSPDHHMDVPLVNNTPDFGYVELHIGNYPSDTKGCLLLGESKATDFVGSSHLAFTKVFEIIEEALKNGTVNLTIQKLNS